MMRKIAARYLFLILSTSIYLLACQINKTARIDPPQIFVKEYKKFDLPPNWSGEIYFDRYTGDINISAYGRGGKTGLILDSNFNRKNSLSNQLTLDELIPPPIVGEDILKNTGGTGWRIDFEGSYHKQTKVFMNSPAIIVPGELVRKKIETFSGDILLYIHDKLILRQHVNNTPRGACFSYDLKSGLLAYYYQPDLMYTAATYLVRVDPSIPQLTPSQKPMPMQRVQGPIKH